MFVICRIKPGLVGETSSDTSLTKLTECAVSLPMEAVRVTIIFLIVSRPVNRGVCNPQKKVGDLN